MSQKGTDRWGSRVGAGPESQSGSRMGTGQGAMGKMEWKECEEKLATMRREGTDLGKGHGHRHAV